MQNSTYINIVLLEALKFSSHDPRIFFSQYTNNSILFTKRPNTQTKILFNNFCFQQVFREYISKNFTKVLLFSILKRNLISHSKALGVKRKREEFMNNMWHFNNKREKILLQQGRKWKMFQLKRAREQATERNWIRMEEKNIWLRHKSHYGCLTLSALIASYNGAKRKLIYRTNQ